ncbi:unnamed protein product [Brassica rapa]|uniref:Uncharacterized protein n=1 Tax=Brassica campestris TaxID=3711 RepID=A0A3P5ZD47_BRACM|nr:unnamed protein product [Brassica rapa]VDC70800.1 unnamed protein product [Brassica rapa]
MHLTFLGFKSAPRFVCSFLVLSLLCFGSRYLLSAAAGFVSPKVRQVMLSGDSSWSSCSIPVSS